MRKMLLIFARDFRVNLRTSVTLLMIAIPLLLAFGVNLFAPGIEDTTVHLALVDGADPAMAAYLEAYAQVERVADARALESRVLARDAVIGIETAQDGSRLVAQGNEPASLLEYARVLKTYYEENRQPGDSTVTIRTFGVETSPVKQLWANLGILLMGVLSGMLTSLNLVDEKMDRTVSAINVTPISRIAWVFGKSLVGFLLALVGSVAMVVILGVAGQVNIAQMLIFVFVASLLSILIGLLQGLQSDDMMTAMASTKMILLPLGASVAGYEFLSAQWQWVLYWSPFYWVYKGNLALLGGRMTWGMLAGYSGIVLGLTALAFIYIAPRIRKGLE